MYNHKVKLYTLDNEFIEETIKIPQGFTGIISDDFGTTHVLVDGRYHKIDGPAIEYSDGSRDWYLYGNRHRIDGPACEFSNGAEAWWLGGKKIHCNTNEEFKLLVDMMKLKGLL